MRSSRIEQGIWISVITAILFATTIFIALPSQALVLPLPGALPPDPGIAGEATIDGIDVNANGVRDDLERAIFASYPNDARSREFLYHMAIYYQAMLRQPTNATVVLNSFGYLAASTRCLELLSGSTSQEDDMLRPEMLNTYDRSMAYITAMNSIANVDSIPIKTLTCTALPAFPYTPPASPSTITVPVSSATLTYSVSWSAAIGAVTRYELQQAMDSGFTAPVTAYSGTALSSGITVTQDGTYYYRVRACNDVGCSDYRTGANGVAVALTIPGVPSSITIPASTTTGDYIISWGTAPGMVERYELQVATEGTNFSCYTTPCRAGTWCVWRCQPAPTIYSGTNFVFNVVHSVTNPRYLGTLYYRVRACNLVGCSEYRAGTNGVSYNVPIP